MILFAPIQLLIKDSKLIFISIAEFHIHIKEKACNFEVYYSIGSIISKSFHVKIDRRHLATTNKKKKFVKRLPHFERKCREVVSRLFVKKSLVFVIRTFFLNMRLQIIATFASTYMMSFEVITSTTLQP